MSDKITLLLKLPKLQLDQLLPLIIKSQEMFSLHTPHLICDEVSPAEGDTPLARMVLAWYGIDSKQRVRIRIQITLNVCSGGDDAPQWSFKLGSLLVARVRVCETGAYTTIINESLYLDCTAT